MVKIENFFPKCFSQALCMLFSETCCISSPNAHYKISHLPYKLMELTLESKERKHLAEHWNCSKLHICTEKKFT